MVMWGHVIKGVNPVFNWICTFHVPVFLVLSGLLFAYKNKGLNSFKHTVNKILWPYLIFSVFAMITDALLSFVDSGSFSASLKMVLIDGYKTIILYGIHALWYLGSYIIAVWIYLKIKDFSIKARAFCEIIFILAGIILSCISSMYKVPTILLLLVVSCIRSLVCSVFLFCGLDLYRLMKDVKTRKTLYFSLGVVLLVISLICAEKNGVSNFSTVEYGKFPWLCLIASFCGAVGLCFVFFDRCIHFLNFFGRNSLILLVTHSSLKITVLSQFLVGIFVNSSSWLFGISCLVVMILVEIPIIMLLNGKLEFLISRPKNVWFFKKIRE